MNEKELITFCRYYFESSNIPLRVYKNDQILYNSDTSFTDEMIFKQNDAKMLQQNNLLSYFVSEELLFWGKIALSEAKNCCVMLGPVKGLAVNELLKTSSGHKARSEVLAEEAMNELISRIPFMMFEQFVRTICFVNYSINGVETELNELVDYEDSKILLPVTIEHTNKLFISKENNQLHNTYQFEKQYLSLIESGDLAKLKSMMDEPLFISPGVVADNTMRQLKNLFIASTTLVTRAAIRGGLDIETAYQLSDVYIQQIERTNAITELYNVQYQELFDFTKRVMESKMPEGISVIVYECINYINSNINQPITVTEVAENVGKSRSFISRKFKDELGFGINEYINSRKIEESKYLLAYTDKSISEISFYLYFSSQSYFQNIFKKKVHMTPNEYRQEFSRKSNK